MDSLAGRNELHGRFRASRFSLFLRAMDLASLPRASVRIVDLGGTLSYWRSFDMILPPSIAQVVIVNLDRRDFDAGRFQVRHGDATNLKEFADDSFDIVHSNSVIEHVGGWGQVQRMAAEIHRLAPRHFIQTPNLWFPIEPHYRHLFYQFMPTEWIAGRLVKRRRGFMGPAQDHSEGRAMAESINLLGLRDMKALFPDSQIYKEKFLGFTKSLVAIR